NTSRSNQHLASNFHPLRSNSFLFLLDSSFGLQHQSPRYGSTEINSQPSGAVPDELDQRFHLRCVEIDKRRADRPGRPPNGAHTRLDDRDGIALTAIANIYIGQHEFAELLENFLVVAFAH